MDQQLEFVRDPQAPEPVSFSGQTLVVGIPSVGNVGQLALDVLITTFGAHRVGYLNSPLILPLIGNDPYWIAPTPTKLDTATGTVTTPATGGKKRKDSATAEQQQPPGILHVAAEVYQIRSKSITLVLFRAPFVKGGVRSFAKQFAVWITKFGFSSVIVLSSANASWRSDHLLSDAPITVHCVTSSNTTNPTTDKSDQSAATTTTTPNLSFSHVSSLTEEERSRFVRGFSKYLLEEIGPNGPLTAVLLILCNEGNNIPHALGVSQAAVSALPELASSQDPVSWVFPSSWKNLFGNPFDVSLFL